MSKKKPQRPRFPSSERTLELPNKELEMVPYRFGANRLRTLNLSDNHIRHLPKKTKGLMSLDLTRNGLTEIPVEIRKRLCSYKHLENLGLEENGLETWPKELDGLKNIRTLRLFANRLTTFSSKCKTLQNLELGQNLITEVPVVPIGISKLMLDYNRITKLSLVAPGIKRLTLNLNNLTEIGPDFYFPDLRFLDLGRNRLTALPDLSVATPSLHIFECADNFITEWPKMPKGLSVVSFKNNEITTLPNLAEEYPCLSVCELGQNKLQEIPPLPPTITSFGIMENQVKSSWSGKAASLKRLVICNNQLESIPVFEDHIMEELNVSCNLIRRVNVDALTITIQRLNLSDNKIKKIPKELFTLPALDTLILARNRIKKIPAEWTICKTLTTFSITENPLESLPEEFPQYLRTLNIAYCNLSQIPEGISKCCFLEELVASGNMLTTVPNLPAIVTLILSRNKLTEIPTCPETLTTLDCSHNLLTAIPEDINYPKLIDLDLSHNDIEFVPQELAIPLIKYFKVSYNPRILETIKTRQYEHLLILNVEGTQMRFVKIPAVREVMTHQTSLWINPYVKLINASDAVGYSEMCGVRESMEDAIVIREDIKDDISLYSVIDGHGGTRTSTISAYRLARYALDNAALTDEFAHDVIIHLNDAIKKMDYPDGATVVMALRQGNQMMTVHLGDARAIIVKHDGSVKFETDDHKPFKRREYERIRDSGSRVTAGRTHGILAVTRSLGDFRIPGVGYEPEINHFEIEPDDKWLVMACDGVWDVITSELCGTICATATDPCHLAVDIKNMAYASGSLDNISVIVVDLTRVKAEPAAPHSVVPEDKMETNMEVPMESCYMRTPVPESFHSMPIDVADEMIAKVEEARSPTDLTDFSLLVPLSELPGNEAQGNAANVDAKPDEKGDGGKQSGDSESSSGGRSDERKDLSASEESNETSEKELSEGKEEKEESNEEKEDSSEEKEESNEEKEDSNEEKESNEDSSQESESSEEKEESSESSSRELSEEKEESSDDNAEELSEGNEEESNSESDQ